MQTVTLFSEELLFEAERVEAEAWSDLLLCAPPALRRALGVHVEHDGDTLALVCPGIDHMLVNRLFGLGREPLLTRQRLAALLGNFDARGVARYMVHVPERTWPSALGDWLTDAGLVRYHRDWVKLARERGPVSSARTTLRIAPVAPLSAEAAAQLMVSAFQLPEAARVLVAALVGRPRWHLFAAHDDERPVAVAGLYVSGRTAYLAFGATAPGHRGRGAQSALIERRLRVAFALGARWVVSETGRASGSDPQHSYRNLARAGLAPLCVRANWVRAGTQW